MSLNTTVEVERGSFIWEIRNYDACATDVKIPSPIFKTDTVHWSLALTKESHIFLKPNHKPKVAFELEGNSEALKKCIGASKAYFVKVRIHAISAANGTTLWFVKGSKTNGSKAYLTGVSEIDVLPEYLVDDVLTLRIDVAFSEVGRFTTSIRLVDEQSASASSNRQSSFETLLADIKSFRSQNIGDVVLCTDQLNLSVHKFILFARSPIFQRMCDDGTEHGNNVIKIPDMSFPDLRRMVDYMYGGEMDGASGDTCVSLYAAAEVYGMPDLKLRCARMLEDLSVDIVCDVASMAHQHQDVQLLASAKSYILSHAAQVVCSNGWLELVTELPALASELAATMLPPSDGQDVKEN